ncbi:MAG: hypothetical protein Q9P44_16225 [Anaerolineae bacterium]|nr:hypothetical protein [Anaerolineae bacterium]
MTARIVQSNNRAQFEKMINRWEGRWRLRRIVLYLPRVLMAAIGIGIITTLILGIFRVVSPMLMVGVISGGIAAIVVLISSALRLFGKNGIEAARQFDSAFDLQERISTAIELMDGRIQTAPELAELQVADAMSHAKDVDPRKHIKLEVRWLEWIGVVSLSLVLIIILGAYALIGSQRNNGTSAATETAVQQAADAVRDITENVATDSALTDEERSNLLESLEVTLDDLSEEPATAEDSFVAMSELEADLSQLAEEISDETAADSAALAAAAEVLQNPSDSDTSDTADSSSLSEELAQMQDALSELTPEQEAALQQQMTAAAAALQEEFPELAQQLAELAQNTPASDSNISEEQLQQMLDDLAAIENDVERRNEAAEALQEAAQQAQEAAQDIAQSESQQGQEQSAQDGQQQSQQSQDGQQQSQQGQQSQDGQPQSAQDGQQQEGESDNAVEGENSGDASAPSDNPDSGQPQVGQPPQQGNSQLGNEGGGAGDSEAAGRQEGLGSVSEQSGGGNSPDGEGEIVYEEVYAPNSINTDGDGNVVLETDTSDSPVVEGDFQDNPTGEVSVPYNQVFRTYEDAANRALENDYVPLGMQDVVRDYFSSLQPTGDNP